MYAGISECLSLFYEDDIMWTTILITEENLNNE